MRASLRVPRGALSSAAALCIGLDTERPSWRALNAATVRLLAHGSSARFVSVFFWLAPQAGFLRRSVRHFRALQHFGLYQSSANPVLG